MDDEVFKMVNIEGQVGFRRAGWFFFCVYIYFFVYLYIFFVLEGEYICVLVLFQATTGSRSTVQSVGKEIPDQGKKKKIFRDGGRKEKSSKKHRSVNT